MSIKSLIKLAENPGFDEFEDDAFGGGDGMGGDDDMFGGEPDGDEFGGGDDMFGGDDEFGDMGDPEFKGKRVSGPRTKLASMDDMRAVQSAIGKLAKSVGALAKVQKAMLEKGGYMDEVDEDEDDESLNLGAGGTAAASKVAKDDAASSFGEKDSNAVGNRPYDQTSPGENDTIIQGAPSDGPGPVSKAELSAMERRLATRLDRAVRQALVKSGQVAVSRAQTPGPGTSTKLEKAGSQPHPEQLRKDLSGRSFSEINRLRAELGELPSSVL